jgi:hypothetical protein
MEDDDSLKHELLAIGRISAPKEKGEQAVEEVPIELEPIPQELLDELTKKFSTSAQTAYLLQLLEDTGRADLQENLRFIDMMYGDISAVELESIQKEGLWDKFLWSVFVSYVGKAIELLGLKGNTGGSGSMAPVDFQGGINEIVEGFIQPIVTEWRSYHPLVAPADTAVFFITFITGLNPNDASKLFVFERQNARGRAEKVIEGLRTGRSEREVEYINDNYDLIFELEKPVSIMSELSISHTLLETFREERRLEEILSSVKEGVAISAPLVEIKRMGEKLVRMKGIPAPKETAAVVVKEPEKAIDALVKGAYEDGKRTTIVSEQEGFAKMVEGDLEKDLEKALKKLEEMALGKAEEDEE